MNQTAPLPKFGPPMHLACDDGEGYFWKFRDNENLFSDSLGELLSNGLEHMPEAGKRGGE